MRWVHRVRKGETGATLIVVTLATLVLFGFAALAVDVGNGMGQRRRAQSTADASVLAAAVELTLQGKLPEDSVVVADDYADRNAPDPISEPAWLNDCPDTVNPGDQLAFTAKELDLKNPGSVVPATDCISFNETFDEIRVSLPQQEFETFFAGVIGIDTLDVTAFAHATINFPGVGNPPPFVATSTVTGGQQICLRVKTAAAILPPQWVGNGVVDGPGGDPSDNPTATGAADPCSDGEYLTLSQLRGTLNPYVYESCTQPGASAMASIIADGIDHPLGVDWDDVTMNTRVDGDGCKDAPEPKPNTMPMQTGTTAQILAEGLLAGGTYDKEPFTGRLQKGAFFEPANPTFAGYPKDNEPLWNFIVDNIGDLVADNDAPDECGKVYTNRTNPVYDYYDLKELMIDCIVKWNPGPHVPIFRETIQDSGLFTFIPQVYEEELDVTLVHFINWVPVWFQKLYQEGIENAAGNPQNSEFCFVQDVSETGNTGWYMHEAGQDFDCGRSNQNVDALASIVIECGMLPATLCDPTTSPGGRPGGQPVWTIELTK